MFMKTRLQHQAVKIIIALIFGFNISSIYAESFADACPANFYLDTKTVEDQTGRVITCRYNNQGYLSEASYHSNLDKADITYLFFPGRKKLSRKRIDYDYLIGYQKYDFNIDGELYSINSNILGLKMRCFKIENQFKCSYDDIATQVKFQSTSNIYDLHF